MSRAQIFEGIFQTLVADPNLQPLLGPKTAQNLRLYRNFPPFQSMLTGNGLPGDKYEPQGREGWLVVEEPQPGLRASNTQYETIYEALEVNFHIFATAYSLADDVVDILDQYFHWTVFQQRLLQYGERFILFSRRFNTEEAYAAEVKLYHKTHHYRLETVLAQQVA